MAGNTINMPSGFGGLVSYKEEYKSMFNLKPVHVVIFILLIIGFRVGMEFLFK